MLEEWVITATHRQDRTFLPPADYCPLCPTKPGGFPTEIPAPTYRDRASSRTSSPHFAASRPHPPWKDVPLPCGAGLGECEVVVYTPDHGSTLADRSVEQIERLIYVWTDRIPGIGRRATTSIMSTSSRTRAK